jgi:hypothetical protein
MSTVTYFVLETETATCLEMLKPPHATAATFRVTCRDTLGVEISSLEYGTLTLELYRLNVYSGGYASVSQQN